MVTINEEFASSEQHAIEQEQQGSENNQSPNPQQAGDQPEADSSSPRPSSPRNGSGPSAPSEESAKGSASEESKSPAPVDPAAVAGPSSAMTQPQPEAKPEQSAGDAEASSSRPAPSTPTAFLQQLLPQMTAVTRVLSIPAVESGVGLVAGVYTRVKNSNAVVNWGLGTAEAASLTAIGTSKALLSPLTRPLSGPLSIVDSLLCRGLDVVEYSVPAITLPPELIVSAGRDYVSMRVLQPALRMTISNAKIAEALASMALESADSYVDRYLPGDAATENGDAGPSNAVKATDALHRADRLSRKLQRRLTKRTLAEARALRKHGLDTLQTLFHFAQMLVRDPRAFVEQCQQVWAHLSENEPENQVPPATLEERLALLIREVARRVVHLTNYTVSSTVTANALQSVQQEGERVLTFARNQLERVYATQMLGDLTAYTHQLLERLAHLLAGLRSSMQATGEHLIGVAHSTAPIMK